MNIDCNDKKKEQNQRGDSVLAAKAGFWYVLGTFVGKALAFITTPIFARLMTTSDYGEFSNFASWVSMLTIVVGAELYNTLATAYYDFKDNYDKYISTVTILGGLITGITYALFFLFRSFIFKVVAIPEQYVHLLFIFLFFSFCRLVYYARERTLYRYKSVAVVTLVSLTIPTLISVFLVYFLPTTNQLSARLYGYYFPSALIGLFCAFSLFNEKGVSFEWRYCRYALVLAIPLLMHYLTAHLMTSTNVIIAKNISGAKSAAVISIAYSTIHIITLFFQAISGALTTWLMDNLKLENYEKIRKGTLFYVIILATVILAAVLLTPELILILGGNKYTASILLIPGMAFSAFVQSITTIFTIILTYDKSVIKTASYTGLIALISVFLKVFLLPHYGLLVLIYVNIAAFSTLFMINYVLIKNAGYGDIILLKQIIEVMLIVGLIVIFSSQLYEWAFLRYMFIGVLLISCTIVVALNKNWFLKFVKK